MLIVVVAAPPLCPPAVAQTGAAPELPGAREFDDSLSFAKQVIARYGLVADHALEMRVNRVGYAVAAQSGMGAAPLVFYVVRIEDPNAFALPGGFVFVTKALLDLDLTDDELAGLLGHEIAHVRNRHSQRMSRRATLLNVLNTVLLAGVMVSASRSSDRRDRNDPFARFETRSDSTANVAQGAAAFGAVLSELLLRGYNRDFETEADSEGMRAAANAGFDPAGSLALMSKLHERIYEEPGFGYWRTHPYFEDRTRAAEARLKFMRAAHPVPSSSQYRSSAAAQLERLAALPKRSSDDAETLEFASLTAWPLGESSKRLRDRILDRATTRQLSKPPLLADYGELDRLYRDAIEEIREIRNPSATKEVVDDPEAARLTAESAAVRQAAAAQYGEYDRGLDQGVGETGFYERFLSNFPNSPRTAEVATRLGENYRLSERDSQAAERLGEALCLDEHGVWGAKARRGLAALLPGLTDMSAAYRLALETPDEALRLQAHARVAAVAAGFTKLPDGARFLRDYPANPYRPQVEARLETLAEKSYGAAVMHRGIGDSQKALDCYNDILSNAPQSRAAARIRESLLADL